MRGKLSGGSWGSKKAFFIIVIVLSLILPNILYAFDNKYVHPYVAEQAFLLWPRTSGEIYDNLGYNLGDRSCAEAHDGATITEGAIEEDSYDPVSEVCNISATTLTYGYNHHFYDPDINSPNNGLLNELGALAYSKIYWYRATSFYATESTKGKAYWYLGRIAHLLADASVPAHVHRDAHSPFTIPFSDFNPDSYEGYTETNYYSWTFNSAKVLDSANPIPSEWTLDNLFYCLAQQAQYFPSDNVDGNTSNISTCADVSTWPDTTGWRKVGFTGDWYIDDSNLQVIGNYMMPRAFQYTAALYKLFWREFHADIEGPDSFDVFSTQTFKVVGKPNGVTVTSWEWDFNNDGTYDATGQSVTHTFKYWGDFTAVVRLNHDDNLKVSKTIHIHPPEITVTYPNGFEDLYRHFSTPVISGVQGYAWNFGDGVVRTDDDNTTSHTYTTSGYYNVTLTQTLSDNTPVQSQVGIFVGPGTRYIQGHTIYGSETWYSGGTFVVQGSVTVAEGATLTIEPGAVVKFNNSNTYPNGPGIKVQGTLNASGTTSQPIVFTSVNDNGVGGATGDGNPAAASWDKISFESTSTNSVLSHVVVKYGGYNAAMYCSYNYDCDDGAIQIYSSSVTIANSEINSNRSGIYVQDASPSIVASNILHNSSWGIYLTHSNAEIRDNQIQLNTNGLYVGNSSMPAITGNTISGNTSYGLYYSGSTVIDATNNYWGDPSGPLDDSDDRAIGGLYNPTGLGNKVSDHVNYYPWTGMTGIGQTGTPTGLSGTPGSYAINLKWNANTEPYLGGYKIYYGTSAGNYGTPKAVGNITSDKLTGLTNGTPYFIAITSMNSVGVESAKSAEITVTPIYDVTNPTSAITDPTTGVALNGSSYTVTGTANDGTGTGVQKIEVSSDGGATWSLATGTSPWSYAWAIPADGNYTIKSRATDNADNVETPGAGVTIKIDNTAPTGGSLTATQGSPQVTLNWKDFTDSESGIDRYKLVYSTSGTPASCSTGKTIYEGPATTYPHTGLTAGTTYYYRVCAIDKAGNVSTGATTSTTVQAEPEESIAVGVQIACPASVKVGKPLTVTVNLYNWDCYESISVNRFMMRVMGNADGTLSGLGIFGPYNRPLGTPKPVPAATCDTSETTPGTVTPFSLTVMSAVPASLSGKMATVDIEAITTKGQTFGGGECVVNVVP